MKIKNTEMLTGYLGHFVIRLSVFLVFLYLYLTDRENIWVKVSTPVWKEFNPHALIWFNFMLIIISHFFPTKLITMGVRKSQEKYFDPVENYSRTGLLKIVKKRNAGAWGVLIVWLLCNLIFGILYLCNVLKEADLFMLTVFFYLCDFICILFFCPFQTLIMKNRCCVNCRIYDWGHFMMFTPMLWIRSFFSWSLFFTSVVLIIHWEVKWAKNPERYWFGSNKNLQCANCKDKLCQIKRKLNGGRTPE